MLLRQSTTNHFEDTEFLSKNILEREGRDVFWLRPTDVSGCPVFARLGRNVSYHMTESLTRDSSTFLCVAAALKKQHKLPLTPAFRSSEIDQYFNGRLEANFNRNGTQCCFNIDDLLPYTNYQGNFAAIFSYSLNADEFWISYLEKAYTKFLGSHSAIFRKSLFELITEMSGCIVERLAIHYKVGDYYTAISNITMLMREYDCFGLVRTQGQWLMFESSTKAEDDVDLFPLRYDIYPDILDDIKMDGDTGELKPSVTDAHSMLNQSDDLLFCWYPTENLHSREIVGSWMCGKNAGGPHFEPSFYTNPQIKLSIHGDFEEDANYQILIQVELLRPYFGTISAKVFKAPQNWEGSQLKRLPSRLLRTEDVVAESESTEKFSRPWVTMRLTETNDGEIFYIIPALPEKEMCGGFRVKVFSSVVIAPLEETRGCKGSESAEKCRKKTCVKL